MKNSSYPLIVQNCFFAANALPLNLAKGIGGMTANTFRRYGEEFRRFLDDLRRFLDDFEAKICLGKVNG